MGQEVGSQLVLACRFFPGCAKLLELLVKSDFVSARTRVRKRLVWNMKMQQSKGFTVVELLIVAVIIAIIAAIVIPKFSAIRERAYFAAMKADLEHLSSRQQTYLEDHYSYSNDLEELSLASSHGVILAITASSSGWSAVAAHSELGKEEGCAIFGGAALPPTEPVTPTQKEEVVCSR